MLHRLAHQRKHFVRAGMEQQRLFVIDQILVEGKAARNSGDRCVVVVLVGGVLALLCAGLWVGRCLAVLLSLPANASNAESDYLIPMTMELGPERCATRVSWKPAFRIQSQQSAPVLSFLSWVSFCLFW